MRFPTKGQAWSLRRFFVASTLGLALFPVLATLALSANLFLNFLPRYFASSVTAMGTSVSKEVKRYLSLPVTCLKEIATILETKPDPGTLQSTLDALTQNQPEIASILILDAAGVVTMTSPQDPSILGIDYSGQPAFNLAASGGPVLSPPYVSPADGSVTLAVYGRAGSGYAGISLRLEELSAFITSIRISNQDRVAVTDQNGLCAAHTDMAYVREQRHLLLPESPTPRRIREDGRTWIVSGIQLVDPPWRVYYYRSSTESDSFIWTLLIRLAIIGLVSVSSAIYIALRVQRHFSRPFTEILARISELARGNYGLRIPMGQVEEFSLISQAFNSMAENVQRRDALIKQDLTEKTILLKEIHHRVKNNLQIMASLLNLGSSCLDKEEALSILKASQDRIHSMALVHEILYESEDFSSIDLGLYADGLLTYLHDAYPIRGLVLDRRLSRVRTSLDKALPFGLILNELVTNSFKYALCAGGESYLRVELTQDEAKDLVVLEVEDHGPGLPTDFDPVNADSLGFSLINGLAAQLGARIQWLPASPGAASPGLKTSLRFPGGICVFP